MVFVAAYGVGQVWSLALALREGSGNITVVATGVLGALLLAFSATVIGRIFHVLHNAPVPSADADQTEGEADDD